MLNAFNKKFAFHFFEDLLHYCMQYVGFEIIGTLRYQQKKHIKEILCYTVINLHISTNTKSH